MAGISLQNRNGTTLKVKTVTVLKYIFESQSELVLEYFNTFKPIEFGTNLYTERTKDLISTTGEVTIEGGVGTTPLDNTDQYRMGDDIGLSKGNDDVQSSTTQYNLNYQEYIESIETTVYSSDKNKNISSLNLVDVSLSSSVYEHLVSQDYQLIDSVEAYLLVNNIEKEITKDKGKSEYLLDSPHTHNIPIDITEHLLGSPHTHNISIDINENLIVGTLLIDDIMYGSYEPKPISEILEYTSPIRTVVVEKDLYFGPPPDKVIPINNYYHRFKNRQASSGDYYEQTNPITVNISYSHIVDNKTFINKVFYLDIDDLTMNQNLVPQISSPSDVNYVIDEHFVNVRNATPHKKLFYHTPDYILYKPQNILYRSEEFKKPNLSYYEYEKDFFMFGGDNRKELVTEYEKFSFTSEQNITTYVIYDSISSMYGGFYSDYDNASEFYYVDMLNGIPSGSYVGIKTHVIPHDKITSIHPEVGGSNAYGHVPIMPPKAGSSNKVIDLQAAMDGKSPWIKESESSYSGRGGRHIPLEYRVSQVVRGGGPGTGEDGGLLNPYGALYEYESINHDFDQQDSSGIGGRYNFIYSVVEGSGRLPECLELKDRRYLVGRISEVDSFLNKYSYEGWVKEQGHYETLDSDYSDFDMVNPRIIKCEVSGVSVRRGTIDVFLLEDDVEFSIGDKITQPTSKSSATITGILSRYTIPYDFADNEGSVERNVISYEIQNMSGEFLISDKNVTYSYRTTSSRQIIIDRLAEIDGLLSGGGLSQTEIDTLTEEKNNLLQTVDVIEDYTVLIVDDVFTDMQYQVIRNQDGNDLKVYESDNDVSGGITKIIDLTLPIYNNWTYDRDKFLITSPELPEEMYFFGDGEYYDRVTWLEKMKEAGYFNYDPEKNKEAMQKTLDKYIDDYLNGNLPSVSEEEYNISVNTQQTLINNLDEQHQMLHLENIEPYLLNCEDEVDIETFYKYSPDVRILRGYPVYAGCN
jgi:hypothetical protein